MAPTPPSSTRRPLTLKGLPRKKPGPVPKPLSERLKNKPPKQVRRVERSYSKERKIEVLMYLLNHRVPDARPRKVPRRRIGQPHEQELNQPMVQDQNGEFVWYRAPTYAEASEFWKIPTPTIQGWWDSRKKLLEGSGFDLPEVGPGGLSATLAATEASSMPGRNAETAASGTEGAGGTRDGANEGQPSTGPTAGQSGGKSDCSVRLRPVSEPKPGPGEPDTKPHTIACGSGHIDA
ncbi:hypothetical protein N0V88_006641 [Collariella sp. IMI 366227]|nr:hypothetical protein N0V88_006641 [Collariella sp. IMI 366227]